MSLFAAVEMAPRDPILGLNEQFNADTRAEKVNLGVGVYYDENGKLPLLKCVAQAEAQMQSDPKPRGYLPIDGIAAYDKAVQTLVFGEGSAVLAAKRVATVQAIGGTGGLKVGADFLKRLNPNAQVLISDPSWENHRVVFEGAGFAVNTYPYYDAASGGLCFDRMLAALQQLPAQSIVLLHACCHNPTGVDLTRSQWEALVPVFQQKGLIAFIDMAYQGFGEGVDEDACAPRLFAAAGIPTLVANSFSKNFSLYGERCGGLSVVSADGDESARVLGQLMATVRANYSNPPTRGAALIATVLSDPALRALWLDELAAMRVRIQAMRQAMHDGLQQQLPGASLARYLDQRGMFTYTGLCPAQVDRLREQYGVYLLRSGRMCIAGLNPGNVPAAVQAVAAVMQGEAARA